MKPKDLHHLEKQLSVTFKNVELLKNAFIHRSYLNENKHAEFQSNEKLEFLGDSVLSLITSVYLYKHYPKFKEGDYTEIKSAIVKTGSLADAALELKLGDYLYVSKGEELGNGRKNKNILADCFEAVIAAIFLDLGYDAADEFVVRYLFKDVLDRTIKEGEYLSSKSKLQELAQATYKTIPNYKVVSEEGPEHRRIFTIAAYINKKKYGLGIGFSKKEAEEIAAKKTLEVLEK